MNGEDRPDPDELLARIRESEGTRSHAELKIFFGMSAGVGKTYAMLQEARAARAQGIDIVLGIIETHGRKETEALVADLELIPLRPVEYRGVLLEELDLDALIARRPAIAIVDELAHANAPGSRHVKRWQDILELLDRGVSVWTAVNVQHMESYADVVEELTGARVRERVPDTVFDRADEVRLIDVAPEDLIRRLEEGAIYTGESSRAAIENFFKPRNLGALREIALRFAARTASHRLSAYARAESGASSQASLGERILVAIGPAPGSAYIARWARRTAYALRADWTAVHVDTGAPMSDAEKGRLEANLSLARKLGAEVLVVPGADVAEAVIETARAKGASMIVVGRSGLSRRGPGLGRASVTDRIMRDAAPIDVALVQDSGTAPAERPASMVKRLFDAPRRQYALLAVAFALLTFLAELFVPVIGYRSVALLFLAAVLGLSFIARPGPVALLAILSALCLNFFFIPPLYTFAITAAEDWLLFGVYFLVAFVTGSLVSRVHSRERLLRDREGAAAFLFGAAQLLSECGTVEAAAEAAARLAEDQFKTEAAVFVDDGQGDLDPTPRGKAVPKIDEREFDVAAYAFVERATCGAQTDTLPSARLRYVPASAGEKAAGVDRSGHSRGAGVDAVRRQPPPVARAHPRPQRGALPLRGAQPQGDPSARVRAPGRDPPRLGVARAAHAPHDDHRVLERPPGRRFGQALGGETRHTRQRARSLGQARRGRRRPPVAEPHRVGHAQAGEAPGRPRRARPHGDLPSRPRARLAQARGPGARRERARVRRREPGRAARRQPLAQRCSLFAARASDRLLARGRAQMPDDPRA